MICELAVATRTHPGEWLDTPDELIATTLDVLEQANKRRR